MKKAPEAFRTISEVADLLDTPAHVLRFWESKFYQIRPVKRAGGRRYYRPDDVALINGIRALLQDRGMTIRGAQRILQEQGAKAVAQLGLPLPAGGTGMRLVAAMDDDLGDRIDTDDDLPFDEDFAIPPAEASQPAETLPTSAPWVSPAQPEDELTMEMQPMPGYADAEAEGEVASRSGISPAAEEHSQGDGAPWTPSEPQVEDAAMSSDDLLAPLADPPADIAPPAPEQDLVAALLRPRPPAAVLPAPEDISEPVGMPDRVRLARSLRAMPRHAPGLQRDRLAILARRIDILLERMSEASGAGRW